MKYLTTAPAVLALILAVAAAAPPAAAQGIGGKPVVIPPGSPGYEISPEIRHYREMAAIMRDMSAQMNRMQDAMEKGDVAPPASTRMQAKLERMAELMKGMSGLVNRPLMNDAEMRKQIELMRKQMTELMQDTP